jgi:ABC-type antimicrobial peptide transport system permease subunit
VVVSYYPRINIMPTLKEKTSVFLTQYVVASIKKDKKGYFIGFVAVFSVTFFLAFFQATISNVRFVFLKTAENEISEADFLLVPNIIPSDNPRYFLNVSDLEGKIKDVDDFAGITTRVPFLGILSKLDSPLTNTTVTVLGIDSEKEKKIGFGRFWKGRVMGKQESYISGPLARFLGVEGNKGQRVVLRIDLLELVNFITQPQGGLRVNGRTINTQVVNADSLTEILQLLTGTSLDGNITLTSNELINGSNVAVSNLLQTNPTFQSAVGPLGSAFIQENLPTIVNTFFPTGITIPIKDLIEPLISLFSQSFIFESEFVVIDVANTPEGKWPRALGNVLIIEMMEIKRIMVEQIDRLVAELSSTGIVEVLNAESMVKEQMRSLKSLDLNHYALQAYLQIKDRAGVYCESTDLMRKRISKLSDKFVNMTTVSDINANYSITNPSTYAMSTPLKDTVEAFFFLQLFLNNIFFVVMLLLAFLGCMVVYALLLGNVESKTYEYGMLRALGMWHQTLSRLLSLNAMSFAIPALFFALVFSSLVNIAITNIFRAQVQLPISPILPGISWLLAIGLGVVMPIVANIVPVRKALSSRLRDALDLYRSSVGEVTVTLQRLADLGLSPELTSLSVVMVIIGVVTFYAMPLSFILNRIDIFLLLMNLILISMLVGLSLVAQILQSRVEYIFLSIYFMSCNLIRYRKADTCLFPLIVKNLKGHRRRNQKTSHMLTITASFLIFAGVMFSLQSKLIRFNAAWILGADIVVYANGGVQKPLPVTKLKQTVKDINAAQNGLIEGVTFKSFGLFQYDFILQTRVGSIPNAAGGRWNGVYGIERNFLDVTYEGFYVERERVPLKNGGNPNNVVHDLYDGIGQITLADSDLQKREPNDTVISQTPFYRVNSNMLPNAPEYIDCIMSYAMKEYSSVDTKSGARMEIFVGDEYGREVFNMILRPRALVSKMPTEAFSSYALFANGPLFVPMQHAQYLLDEAIHTKKKILQKYSKRTKIPIEELIEIENKNRAKRFTVYSNNGTVELGMQAMLIKTRASSSLAEREIIINNIKSAFDGGIEVLLTVLVVDTRDLIEQTESAIELLNLVLTLIGLICMVLCFLVSFVSFEANIIENAREFAVLRAIGVSSRQVQKSYILEALANVLSSFFLGCIIGIVIATSLSLQMNLFLEAPFELSFPAGSFLLLFGMAIIVAFVASYLPSDRLIRQEIAHVIKTG